MTNYVDLVRDFARRTRQNLEFVEQHRDDPEIEVYEVTQLINSMLGLLVFPQQKYVDQIPKTALTDLEAKGWPSIKTTKGALPTQTLNSLVRHLRNSISHFNIEFLANNQMGTIRGVRLWNTTDGTTTGPRNWEAELTLIELRKIADKFIEMLEAGEFEQNPK